MTDLTPVPTGNDIQVNTVTSGDQLYSSVAALDGGGFVVTWSSSGQDGSGYGIYGQRYTAAGSPAGTEFRVNTFTNSAQIYSSVAALDGGGFVVTWSSFGQDGSVYGIYGQRYTAAGSPAGTEFRVNTVTNSDQIYSSVAALNGGGFVVTWSSSGQDGSNYDIYGQRYTAAGSPAGTEFRVNTLTSDYQLYSSVAALDGGGFVVTWSSYGQDGSGWGIYGQRYTAAGSPAGTDFRVNTLTSDNQIYSSVAALDDGGFVVTWSSYLQDGSSWGIYGQRYTAAGSPAGTEFRVNTVTNSDQIYSSVAALDDGGFVVTWLSFLQDGSGWGIYGQRYDAAGQTRGTEFRLNGITSADQLNISFNGSEWVAQLEDGRLVATWHGNGPSDGNGVVVRLIDVPSPNQAPAGTDATITINEDTSYAFSAADFGFTDADAGDVLVSVRIDTLPAIGQLRLDADGAGPIAPVLVTAGQTITAADIASGKLTYTPPANANGDAYASLDFSVNDGTNFDPTPNTLTIDVTPVNDAPTFIAGDGVASHELVLSAQFVAQLSDGRMLILGRGGVSGTLDFAVGRLNADGSIDTGFGGGDGFVTTDFGSFDFGEAGLLQPDGKMIIVGTIANESFDIGLARYNTDGSLDSTFGGGDGLVETTISFFTDAANAVALQPDGKIIVAGRTGAPGNADVLLLRYTADGLLDTSFGGGDGIVITPVADSGEATGVVVQQDGKILVSGYTADQNFNQPSLLIRYTGNGDLDTSFGGGDGIVVPPFQGGPSNPVVLQGDGKILAIGIGAVQSTPETLEIAIARYNPDGNLDLSFGGGDGVVTAAAGELSLPQGIVLQPDGKFIVAADSTSLDGLSNKLALLRFNSDGTPDTSFGTDGIVVKTAAGPIFFFEAITLTPDGKIIIVGGSYGLDENFDFTNLINNVLRFNADGSPDATFGPDETLGGTVGFVEDGAPVVLDSDVNITDADLDALNGGSGDYAGATLTIARNGGANADDSFAFKTNGASFTVSGNALQSGGQTFATFTVSAGQLTIAFTSSATAATSALTDDVLRSVVYANASNSPPSSVVLNWTFSDGNSGTQGPGGALIASGTTTVEITPVNDAPTLAAALADATAFEDAAFSLSIAAAFADVDVGDTLSFSATLAGGAPLPAWLAFNGATGTFSGTPLDGDVGTISVIVTATDSAGASVSDTFALTIEDTTGVTITGTSFADTINATQTVAGRPLPTNKNDIITTGGGNDVISSLGGRDTIAAGAGTDIIDAGAGDDTILYFTGDGADTIDGGTGFDTLAITGAAGTDNYKITYDGTAITVLNGGAISNIESVTLDLLGGANTLFYTAPSTAAVSVNLAAGTASGFTSIANVTHVTGGSGADTLIGTSGANTLNGGAGNDILIGGEGLDTLIGGTGSDTIVYDTQTADLRIDLVANTVDRLAGAAWVREDNLATIENAIGGTGNDTFTGNNSANRFEGGAGNDSFDGGYGADTLIGGAGNDRFYYSIDDGADTIDGGADIDELIITGSVDFGIEANDRLDVVFDGVRITAFETATVTNVENISADLGGGIDQLNYGATAAAVTVNLDAGVASGFTSIANIENVVGGSGNDTIIGDGLDNRLNGGAGNDILTGRLGNDTFVFTPGFGNDTITDFDGDGGLGAQDFLTLVGFGILNAADLAANVSFTEIGSDVVLAFGSGDTITISNATLAGPNAITDADFIFMA